MGKNCKCGLPKNHSGNCPKKVRRRPGQINGDPKRISPKPLPISKP